MQPGSVVSVVHQVPMYLTLAEGTPKLSGDRFGQSNHVVTTSPGVSLSLMVAPDTLAVAEPSVYAVTIEPKVT